MFSNRQLYFLCGKREGLDACYNTTSELVAHCFALTDIAADWHGLIVLQCSMWPGTWRAPSSIAHTCLKPSQP